MAGKKNNSTIYLGADHRGFKLKEQIKEFLKIESLSYEDCGDLIYKKNDDYPDYARQVATKIQKSKLQELIK